MADFRLAGLEIELPAVVHDRQRLAVVEDVPGLGMGHPDVQAPAPNPEAERVPGQALGETGREADHGVPVTQAAEAVFVTLR